MKKLSILAPAKINLYLDVLNKREDGYHNIETIMQSISIYDTVSLSVFDSDLYENEIEISSNDSSISWDSSNIVYKGAKLFIDRAKIQNKRLSFFVDKQIPICAGMAGGSADVAGALILLNEAFNNRFSLDELCAIGARLGADVPFCIVKGTCLCEGIGEKITPLPSLKNVFLVCALGDEPKASTKYAYATLDKASTDDKNQAVCSKKMIDAISKNDILGIASLLYNKFELVGTNDIPKIKSLLLSNGAIGALMSGSGPSVFGIFSTEDDASKAFSALKNANFKAFVCKTV